MSQTQLMLWILIISCIFTVSLILHRELKKRSVFETIYGKYKGKHEKKVNLFKEEFLEEYYFNQRKMKEKNREHNKEFIFRDAA